MTIEHPPSRSAPSLPPSQGPRPPRPLGLSLLHHTGSGCRHRACRPAGPAWPAAVASERTEGGALPEASVSCPGSGQEGGWACPDLRDEKTEVNRPASLRSSRRAGPRKSGPQARGITPFCKPGGSHTERSRGRAVRPPEREMGGGGERQDNPAGGEKVGMFTSPSRTGDSWPS